MTGQSLLGPPQKQLTDHMVAELFEEAQRFDRYIRADAKKHEEKTHEQAKCKNIEDFVKTITGSSLSKKAVEIQIHALGFTKLGTPEGIEWLRRTYLEI